METVKPGDALWPVSAASLLEFVEDLRRRGYSNIRQHISSAIQESVHRGWLSERCSGFGNEDLRQVRHRAAFVENNRPAHTKKPLLYNDCKNLNGREQFIIGLLSSTGLRAASIEEIRF